MYSASTVKRRRSKDQQLPAVTADVSRTFFALCKKVNSPHSLALWLCFQHDHEAFVEITLDPGNYGDAQIASYNATATPQYFAYDLLCQEYLSKYKGLSLKRDVSEEAIRSFKESESNVGIVNRTLRTLRSGENPRLEAIISIARRKISELLGVRSDAEFEFGWGPGSTFSISGDVGWDRKILEKRISVTASALPIASTTIGADIHWCQARGIPSEGPCSLLSTEFKVVPGNRITTVPKNAKTDRTIAIEPTANIYLQKGIASWFRRRLKKVARIDLQSQGTNQKFASRLDYATIDLKAASDSVSLEIVRLLLPEEWVFLLDVLRSPCYKMDGVWHRYEKWSSMGNGYTFELETLLFWALSIAVQLIDSDGSPHAIVYGDDILVPVRFARGTISTLESFGFKVNTKKTHYEFLYRESCGAHFYNGILVTPVYQKEVPNHVGEVYHMANRLRRVASRLGGYHYSDAVVRSAWLSVVQPSVGRPKCYGPTSLRWEGGVEPNELGLDGQIHLSIEDCASLGLPIFLWGTRVNTLVVSSRKRKFDQAAGLCFSLQGSSSFEGRDLLALRRRSAIRLRRKRCFLSFGSNAWL